MQPSAHSGTCVPRGHISWALSLGLLSSVNSLHKQIKLDTVELVPFSRDEERNLLYPNEKGQSAIEGST